MEKFRDRLWIWGQTAGSHRIFGLPAESHMTPTEGCEYLGIPNMCRVTMSGDPAPKDFEREAKLIDSVPNVVWSIVGDSSSKGTEGNETLDAVLELAKHHKNIVGAVMDDILHESRRADFPPERLAGFAERLHAQPRPLDLWSVLYDHELEDWAIPYLKCSDVMTFWTWKVANLAHYDKNVDRVHEMFPGKKLLLGIYLWDFELEKEIDGKLLAAQLESVYKRIKSGDVYGAIVCSNCEADLGLPATDIVREWIKSHADENV